MPDPYRKLTAGVVTIGTQLRRIADAMTTPVTDDTDTVATTPDDGRQAPVPLATPCVRCGHARNWHEPGERCTVTAGENSCGCQQFIAHLEPASNDEAALRGARRDSLLVLLSRAQRGVLTTDEGTLLRQHVEAEMQQRDNLATSYSRLTEMCSEYTERAIENGERAEQAEARAAVCREDAEHNATRAETAEQRRDELAATLADVLSHFTHKGHPGEPCLQTGWVAEKTFARWRAVLYPPAPEEQQ